MTSKTYKQLQQSQIGVPEIRHQVNVVNYTKIRAILSMHTILCSPGHQLWIAQWSKCIYIYKEELKTVVREFLACTQPNRYETSTVLWNPYRRVSLRGRLAQIRFSRGARGEKRENNRPPFWFYGESIRDSVHGSHNVIAEAPS